MKLESDDVLVIEDDATINAMIGEYLRLEGHGYRAALDGTQGLREATSRKPSLVILDLMLPDMDGFEVCRRLKEDERTLRVPILILSALGDPESRRTGMECGAADYITKPFDPDALLDVVRNLSSPNEDGRAPEPVESSSRAD